MTLLRPCAVPGCDELTVDGRCEQHRTPSWQRSSGKWRDGIEVSRLKWERLRRQVLRSQPVCSVTGCRQKAVQVDHLVPLSEGGRTERSNLHGLCAAHHARKSAAEGARAANRRRRSW